MRRAGPSNPGILLSFRLKNDYTGKIKLPIKETGIRGRMPKICLGLLAGAVAGVVDIIPMLAQKLSWDANLSAFALWVISGFLIATTSLKLNAALKGIVISFLVLTPSAVLISWKELLSLLPISGMTLILGGLLGYVIEKWGK
jgi:hypothetical protein